MDLRDPMHPHIPASFPWGSPFFLCQLSRYQFFRLDVKFLGPFECRSTYSRCGRKICVGRARSTSLRSHSDAKLDFSFFLLSIAMVTTRLKNVKFNRAIRQNKSGNYKNLSQNGGCRFTETVGKEVNQQAVRKRGKSSCTGALKQQVISRRNKSFFQVQ